MTTMWWEDGRLRNMSEADAADVWADYDVGMQYLAEVLVCKGLW